MQHALYFRDVRTAATMDDRRGISVGGGQEQTFNVVRALVAKLEGQALSEILGMAVVVRRSILRVVIETPKGVPAPYHLATRASGKTRVPMDIVLVPDASDPDPLERGSLDYYRRKQDSGGSATYGALEQDLQFIFNVLGEELYRTFWSEMQRLSKRTETAEFIGEAVADKGLRDQILAEVVRPDLSRVVSLPFHSTP